jgi:4-hydroxybenzoate polyprenyltransferase
VARSLWIARAMHLGAIACLALLGIAAGLGPVYFFGVAAVAALLVYEQSLVSAADLSKVKLAFDLNGYVGILYFVMTAISVYAGR